MEIIFNKKECVKEEEISDPQMKPIEIFEKNFFSNRKNSFEENKTRFPEFLGEKIKEGNEFFFAAPNIQINFDNPFGKFDPKKLGGSYMDMFFLKQIKRINVNI